MACCIKSSATNEQKVTYTINVSCWMKYTIFMIFNICRVRRNVNFMTPPPPPGMGIPKLVNLTTPWAGVLVLESGLISDRVKMHNFFWNLLLYTQTNIKETDVLVVVTMEAPIKIVNFMTTRAGILVLGGGHILSHIVNMHYSLRYLLLYTQA